MPRVQISQLSTDDLQNLSRDDKIELIKILDEKARRAKGKEIYKLFPEEGKFSRHTYPRQMEFFAYGKTHNERLFLAANRVGKTVAGGYEMTCHLTGEYPPWWEGFRFEKPIKAWCAGDTGKTTRDILQEKMMGPLGGFGTGLIPLANLGRHTNKQGVADAVEIVYVKHKSGGQSILHFKSYDQKREAFQGTEQEIIWLDEEPPEQIYTECLLRTMTVQGLVYVTATPLMGITPFIISFFPDLTPPS